MVLADLGSKLSVALRKMASQTVIDQEVLDAMLQDICKALLQADVNVAQARRASARDPRRAWTAHQTARHAASLEPLTRSMLSLPLRALPLALRALSSARR
jgi:signal recognition particle GTPase